MDIQKMIDDYARWLKSEITFVRYGEYFELTTPYLDRYNDYFQIYVKRETDGHIVMTDDGYIIGNLRSSGISFRAGSRRNDMLEKIMRNFSVSLDGEAIVTTATAENFPQKKHQMVQAMLSIDDMFEVSPENVKNFFVEDIETFFKANEIYYSRDFSLLGKTGDIYTYEFHFQRTRNQPERFCKAINRVDTSKRNLAIFNWIDTQEKRNNEGKLIVMLNDENKISPTDLDAFKSYRIEPILFSHRQQHIDLFSAA